MQICNVNSKSLKKWIFFHFDHKINNLQEVHIAEDMSSPTVVAVADIVWRVQQLTRASLTVWWLETLELNLLELEIIETYKSMLRENIILDFNIPCSLELFIEILYSLSIFYKYFIKEIFWWCNFMIYPMVLWCLGVLGRCRHCPAPCFPPGQWVPALPAPVSSSGSGGRYRGLQTGMVPQQSFPCHGSWRLDINVYCSFQSSRAYWSWECCVELSGKACSWGHPTHWHCVGVYPEIVQDGVLAPNTGEQQQIAQHM